MGVLLLAGAGHAHMTIMQAIPALVSRGHKVTAVGPGERHYYSGMGPGMLGGAYQPGEISFPVRAMVESLGGTFIRAKVVGIDGARKTVTLDSGQVVPYDVLSCNLGSFVPQDIVQQGTRNAFTVKPIENLLAARARILELARDRTVRVGVCGGGPAALEVAGNAWAAGREQGGKGCIVQIFAGSELLKNMPAKVRRLARQCLDRRDIQVFSDSRVQAVETGLIHVHNGRSHAQDVVLLALGVRPSRVFADSGLPVGQDGGLLVDHSLQSVAHPDILGGGDCICFAPRPLDKVGVYAVRQNPVLLHNVQARLEGGPARSFTPGGSYLLIFNMGANQGILHKNGLAFSGRVAFWIKDLIDRRFIRAFAMKHGPGVSRQHAQGA